MASEQTIPTADGKTQLPDREQLKSDAAEMMETAKEAGRQRLETGKQVAAEQADKMAGAIDQASVRLRETDLQSLADYAGQVASTIKNVSDNLRNRSIDELITDTKSLARNNPTLFLVGSIAVGIAISRFFKASAERQPVNYPSQYAERPPEAIPQDRQSIPGATRYSEPPDL